jgi:cytochrome c553
MMKRTLKALVLLTMMISFTGNLALAGSERDPLQPRVPKSDRGTAKKMKSPFGDLDEASAEIVAEGKKIFEGKGTCVNCHGKDGDGQGPAGKVLNPGPRDFTNCKFHKKRKDGELMWVVMNGSPGTGMVSMIPATISEEEGWKVLAYERSFCKK